MDLIIIIIIIIINLLYLYIMHDYLTHHIVVIFTIFSDFFIA